MSRHTLIFATIWIALAGVIYYIADGIQNPNKISKLGDASTVVLKRGLDGHYRSEAVSYTHLDVYKRQAIGHCATKTQFKT